MNQGKTVFAQLMSNISKYKFEKCVERYKGNYKVQIFNCLEHFYVMCFAQLTYRESLRDIAACLVAFSTKLYHIGIKNAVPKPTLAEANEHRDRRIYADFAQVLIKEARMLYKTDNELLNEIDNMAYRRVYSSKVDKSTGLKYDQKVKLTGYYSKKDYPDYLRIVKFRDSETGINYVFLTNNFILPAITIAQLYKERWKVELFFKWIKQHLRIKAFYGTSHNAVYCQT